MLGSELMSYAAGAGAWGRLNGVVLPIFETSIADDVTGDVTPSAAFPAAACAAFGPPNAELSTTAGVLRAGSVIKLSVDAQVSPGTNKRCNCGARFGVDVCTTARYTVRCRLSMTIQNIQPRDTVAVTAAEHVFSVQAMKVGRSIRLATIFVSTASVQFFSLLLSQAMSGRFQSGHRTGICIISIS